MQIPTGLGSLIAIVVLVVAIVLLIVGQIPIAVGALIAALAVARLT